MTDRLEGGPRPTAPGYRAMGSGGGRCSHRPRRVRAARHAVAGGRRQRGRRVGARQPLLAARGLRRARAAADRRAGRQLRGHPRSAGRRGQRGDRVGPAPGVGCDRGRAEDGQPRLDARRGHRFRGWARRRRRAVDAVLVAARRSGVGGGGRLAGRPAAPSGYPRQPGTATWTATAATVVSTAAATSRWSSRGNAAASTPPDRSRIR